MSDNKKWGLPAGRQGSLPGDPVTEIVRQNRAESERKRLERQDRLDELKGKAEEKRIEAELTGEEKQKMTQLEQEKAELQKDLGKMEIAQVKTELGGKIDQLQRSIEGGASKKSIAEQIAEVKQVATDIGLGGNRFSEIQEALALVDKMRPNKGIAEQLKEAKELLEPFEGKNASAQVAPEIAIQLKKVDIELKKMDIDHQIRIEQMRDERDRRDKEWALTVKQWEDDKELKRAELTQKAAADAERMQFMKGTVNTFGKVIGQSFMEDGGVAATAQQKKFTIFATTGEEADVECPGCKASIFLPPDANDLICPTCGSIGKVVREAATKGKVGK